MRGCSSGSGGGPAPRACGQGVVLGALLGHPVERSVEARERCGLRRVRGHGQVYKERNTVERCISKLKQFRAVATRYDKREAVFQGTIDVASIQIWLRDLVS
jgi:hypothetical protein